MNQTDRLERDLTAWFVETAAPRTPDYVDLILTRAAGTRQRPAWSFPERWLPVSVTTVGRQTLRPVPWRTIGILVLLAVLLAAALAIYVGSQPRLPEPFGPARNGLLVLEEQGDIITVDPTSGSRTVVVGGPTVDSSPVFSRGGTRLAFFRDSGGFRGLWVANADGGSLRELTSGPLQDADGIEWSPDGRSIMTTSVVDGVRSILLVSTAGGNARVLDVGMPAEGPKWRPPDGDEILFRGTSTTGFGLFAVRPDGSGLRAITSTDGGHFGHVYDGLYFAWSPDGALVAYQWVDGTATCGPVVCGQHMYVVKADGTDRREITTIESVNLYWSPDGSRIAFWNMESPYGSELDIVPVDGSGPPIQTGPYGSTFGVGWTPDGTRLLHLADGGASPLLLDPGGGPSTAAGWTSSSFPDWQRLAP